MGTNTKTQITEFEINSFNNYIRESGFFLSKFGNNLVLYDRDGLTVCVDEDLKGIKRFLQGVQYQIKQQEESQ